MADNNDTSQNGGSQVPRPPREGEKIVRRKKKHRHSAERKRRTIRIVLIVICVILALAAIGGFSAFSVYNGSKSVKEDASAVMSDISDLKDLVISGESDKANATAQDIAKHAQNMKNETSGWTWAVASIVPVYGSDIAKVRELASTFDDLADDAIVPLVEKVSKISMDDLLVDDAVNVELATQAIDALNDAAPAIKKAYSTVNSMDKANLDQVNAPIEKAREKLKELNDATQFVATIAPTFTDMLGANGKPRTYVIVAQNNAEIRSTGGFLGSVGPLTIDDGKIELGDFRRVYDIYPPDGVHAPLTDEERDIFGEHISYQIADSNFIPDFARSAEIVKFAWETRGYEEVDGVIGVDPVFLQDMLSLVGPITTEDGTVVDGTNAAEVLLHDAYYIPGWKDQDAFFEEVAALAFKQFMANLGKVSISDFSKILSKDIETRRLQVWMNDEDEEKAIETIGADGKLSHDMKSPTLGIYFIDESYSKLFWYLNRDVEVGDAVKNSDGSFTYPVTLTYKNMIEDEENLPAYTASHSSLARSPGDMICWIMLSAPEGGKISDFEFLEGEFLPEGTSWRTDGSYVSGTMTQATLQGLDFWYGFTHTQPGDSFSMKFNVTTTPGATAPLDVVITPDTQEVAGW